MKRLILTIALGLAVTGSLAMAMSSGEAVAPKVDEAQMQARIDSHLHDMLVRMRVARASSVR